MRMISKNHMNKAKSIFNFSIFSLAGASIGFVISLLFLNNDMLDYWRSSVKVSGRMFLGSPKTYF